MGALGMWRSMWSTQPCALAPSVCHSFMSAGTFRLQDRGNNTAKWATDCTIVAPKTGLTRPFILPLAAPLWLNPTGHLGRGLGEGRIPKMKARNPHARYELWSNPEFMGGEKVITVVLQNDARGVAMVSNSTLQ